MTVKTIITFCNILLTYHVYVLMIENSSFLVNKFPDDGNCYWLAKAWAKNLTLKNLLSFRKSWIQGVKYVTQSETFISVYLIYRFSEISYHAFLE